MNALGDRNRTSTSIRLDRHGRVCFITRAVQRHPKFLSVLHGAMPAVACLLVTLLFLATTFAATPALHKHLHPDSKNSDHFCLVCLLVKGHATPASVASTGMAAALILIGALIFSRILPFASDDYRHSPSRAPPFVFSSITVVG